MEISRGSKDETGQRTPMDGVGLVLEQRQATAKVQRLIEALLGAAVPFLSTISLREIT
jgi:hypothetical protein